MKKSFDSEISQGNIKQAQQKLAELKKHRSIEKQWIKSASNQLDNAIDQKAAEALKRGQIFYSKGEIAVAIQVWKEALVFAPNDKEIKENLERAEKFQEKFNALAKPKK